MAEVPEVKKIKPNAERYEDVTGEFTASEFKRSFWFTKHKVLFYRIMVGVLISLSVVLWIFSMWRWGDYLFFGIRADKNLSNNLSVFPNYTGIHPHFSPVDIAADVVNVFNSGASAYDFSAEVINTNPNFVVRFDYHFVADGVPTLTQSAFLLAGERRPLVFFGYKNGYPNSVNLVLENVNWSRISGHEIKDPILWQKERLGFSVSNFSFTPTQSEDDIQANAVKFNLRNDSSYGYRDGEFIVGLLNNDTLVGIMPLYLTDFKSLETRAVDLRNFTNNLFASNAVVYPIIDIYDKTVYLAPER